MTSIECDIPRSHPPPPPPEINLGISWNTKAEGFLSKKGPLHIQVNAVPCLTDRPLTSKMRTVTSEEPFKLLLRKNLIFRCSITSNYARFLSQIISRFIVALISIFAVWRFQYSVACIEKTYAFYFCIKFDVSIIFAKIVWYSRPSSRGLSYGPSLMNSVFPVILQVTDWFLIWGAHNFSSILFYYSFLSTADNRPAALHPSGLKFFVNAEDKTMQWLHIVRAHS